MNNNMTTERSLRGLYSTSSYITIGDHYGQKPKPDPRHIGKQLMMEAPHRGMAGARTNNTVFDREHKWLFGGEKYIDRTMYTKTQPDRKKGFNSSDAFKSDEFTQHFPTEQYRERLHGEHKIEKMWAKQREEEMEKKKARGEPYEDLELKPLPEPDASWTHGPKWLFDVGKEEEGGTTPYNMKDARDTWYSRNRGVYSTNNPGEKTRYGPNQLSSQQFGYGCDNVKVSRPAFARLPIVRESFFRSTGILPTGRSPVI